LPGRFDGLPPGVKDYCDELAAQSVGQLTVRAGRGDGLATLPATAR
jgi:hypothetical protein